MSSLTYADGVLVYRTPYHPGLVAALKATIPSSDRKWAPAPRRAWMVDPKHADQLVALTAQYLGEAVTAPLVPTTGAEPETCILEVHYIGMTKDRGGGSRSAFGWSDGDWSVVFPEEVLREWFGAGDRPPGDSDTLYMLLGLKQDASPREIKRAYRRLALQWHPDVCSEPDAHMQFIRIKHAYDLLGDEQTRRRYDAGLQLETSVPKPSWAPGGLGDVLQKAALGYRSPLRCGLIMATGERRLGRFVTSEIHAWQDITDAQGRVLVTSWPAGADSFREAWQ